MAKARVGNPKQVMDLSRRSKSWIQTQAGKNLAAGAAQAAPRHAGYTRRYYPPSIDRVVPLRCGVFHPFPIDQFPAHSRRCQTVTATRVEPRNSHGAPPLLTAKDKGPDAKRRGHQHNTAGAAPTLRGKPRTMGGGGRNRPPNRQTSANRPAQTSSRVVPTKSIPPGILYDHIFHNVRYDVAEFTLLSPICSVNSITDWPDSIGGSPELR